MENPNKFTESIADIMNMVPLTYRLVQSMNNARDLPSVAYTPSEIEVSFFESKCIEPSGFYRPISKIIRLDINETK